MLREAVVRSNSCRRDSSGCLFLNCYAAHNGRSLGEFCPSAPSMRQNHRSYLRMCRRRSGLTQDELAFLLSGRDASAVSRYERGRRRPGISIAFGYEAIFGISARNLLEGLFAEVEQNVLEQASRLIRRVESEPDGARKRRKLAFLAQLLGRRRLP
jgi:transcriptional regulator with XRE-family HTH domain